MNISPKFSNITSTAVGRERPPHCGQMARFSQWDDFPSSGHFHPLLCSGACECSSERGALSSEYTERIRFSATLSQDNDKSCYRYGRVPLHCYFCSRKASLVHMNSFYLDVLLHGASDPINSAPWQTDHHTRCCQHNPLNTFASPFCP
jgi:hypothetical protein